MKKRRFLKTLASKINSEKQYTVKKRSMIFPSPAGMSLTTYSFWPGIIKLFPARESLVSEIPAGDGKIDFF